MAIRAIKILFVTVFGVAETRVEGDGVRLRAAIRRKVMTGGARTDVAPRRRCFAGRVALITGVVRREACGDGHAHAAPQSVCVTGGAAHRGSGFAYVVLRVVKLRVEAFIEFGRERAERRIVARQTRMTNVAHRNSGSHELGRVAIGASLVSRKARRGGIVCALMTRSTGQTRVAVRGVREL